MSNIISSEFSRLLKSRLFRILLIVLSLLSAYSPIMEDLRNFLAYPEGLAFCSFGFYFVPIFLVPLGFASAIFSSLFIGRDFSDGTINNKLISGHSRSAIYSAYLIVCILAGIIMELVYTISSAIFGLITLGIMCLKSEEFMIMKSSSEALDIILNNPVIDDKTTYICIDIQWDYLFKFLLSGIFIIAVYCALFLMISVIAQTKSRAVIASIIAMIALVTWGEIVSSSVAPVTYYEYNEEETFEEFTERMGDLRGEALSGTKKTVMLFLDDFIPYNQSLAILDESFTDRQGRIMIYDCGIIAVITAVGILIFNKIDLKSGVKSE